MKLVIGCGYLGSRVAQLWKAQGDPVAVLTRSETNARRFAEMGYRPFVGDVTEPDTLTGIKDLRNLETVLFAVGFDRASRKTRRAVCVEGLRRTLQVLRFDCVRFVYVSTIGVYGQRDGSWIDEDSPSDPTTENGRLFLEAENLLRSNAIANRSIILRLAGIYGPGRVPRSAELVNQALIKADPDSFLNLIHVEDAARAVLAIEAQSQPPRTYVLSDGHPVIRRDYYGEAARLLGGAEPQFAEATYRQATQTRGGGNKRVDIARFTREVKFEFHYPTFKSGLAALRQPSS